LRHFDQCVEAIRSMRKARNKGKNKGRRGPIYS
jgi:hypothetical protein